MAAPTNKEKLLIQVLRKIPIFNGLALTQVKKIIGLCQHKSYKLGKRICESGSRPDEMFILLSGELAIITPEGLWVATILPVTTIGEIGVITGQPRVASVEVTKTGALFTIQKAQFDAILREDQDMQAKVFRAIIAVLQRRLKGNQSRVAIALDMVAAKTGMDREELNLHVEDQVKDLIPRVLIVDDEAEFRLLVKDALPGSDVVEAENGRQALDVVQEVKLDLVITDIKMPVLDGIKLLETLRAQFPGLKVLAASGYLDADDVCKHPFDGFVEKPLAPEPFQQLVEQTLSLPTG